MMSKSMQRRGSVVTYSQKYSPPGIGTNSNESSVALTPGDGRHESLTLQRMAEKLAALKGYEFLGEYDPTSKYGEPVYFIPIDTLLRTQAQKLGIQREDQLFGGSVAYPFMATKSITHGLVNAGAAAPKGWTPHFSQAVNSAVLAGYSVFSEADAHVATTSLLKNSAVRVKSALGIGGNGQTVVTHIDQLQAVLDEVDPIVLAEFGLAIEQNLEQVVTYSVGQVQLAGLLLSYYGTQDLTKNHRGEEVYGGSTLHVVRGNFDALKKINLPAPINLGVEQAHRYDTAANAHFPHFMASRRNYDVVHGVDNKGASCTGVLEQSWRIGGASPAEIAALEAFAGDPELLAVQASSHEVYGDIAPPPASTIYFQGTDPRVGNLIKYSTIDRYEYRT